MTPARVIAASHMQQLLETGQARALLDGHFPVPVELDGEWWQAPTQLPPNGQPGDFVPATEPLAAEFRGLAARRRAADAAVRALEGRDRA